MNSSDQHSIFTILDGLDVIETDSDWDPKSVTNESRINLIEVKAMIIYAKKKLNKILDREEDADTK